MTLGLGLAGTDDTGEAGEVSTTLGLAVPDGTVEVGSSAVLVVQPATIVPTSSAHATRRQRRLGLISGSLPGLTSRLQ